VGSFVADTDVSGGSTAVVSNTIDMSHVTNPAPQAVYQSERFGNSFTYTVPGLVPATSYVARLHFAEIYWGAPGGASGGIGSRVFNVAINGTQVLSNYDIYADAGGADIATIKQFQATASVSGTITIQYTTVTNNAKSSGIEIVPGTLPPTATPTATAIPTSTATATPTNTPVPPTATSTNTPIPPTATPTATFTPVPPTATATAMPTPTRTPTPVNLALNQPATSSSNESASYPPSNAVDGNTSTRWSSSFSDPQWLQVDLGATKAISKVVLRWETAYGKSYQIQVSNDATTWTTIYSTTTGPGGTEPLSVTGSGRYIRMYGTQRGATNYGYSLYEFEVY